MIGLGLFAAAAFAAAWVATALHTDWRSFSPPLAIVSVAVALPVTLVIHEAIHGLVFMAIGGRPRFGGGVAGGMPYLYAACPEQRFPRGQFLLVGLAPLVVLDALALLLLLPAPTAAFGAGVLAFNTSGAVGDLWAVAVILQAPRWVELEDIGPTFVAWAPREHAAEAASLRRPRGLDVPSGRWVMVWFVIMLAVNVIDAGVIGSLARSAAGGVWLGPLFLASRHQVNLVGALLVAAVLAVPITFWPRQLRRGSGAPERRD